MRKFGSERLQGLMTRVGMDDDVPLEHPWVTKSIEKAQTRVEQMYFEIRKNLLKFDDVMDTQRDTIYTLRDTVLASATDVVELPEHEGTAEDGGLAALAEKDAKPPTSLKTTIWGMIERVVRDGIEDNMGEKAGSPLETPDRFQQWLTTTFPIEPTWKVPLAQASPEEIQEQALEVLRAAYEEREAEMGPEMMRVLERLLLLDRIDDHWKEHLHNIDYIEEGIRFARDMAAKIRLSFSKTKHSLSLKVCINRLRNRSVNSSSNPASIQRHRAGSPVDGQVGSVDHSRGHPKAGEQPQPVMMPNSLHSGQWEICRR